jgi:crotonobetainyl-CoA:carnitine CoA-transferase CaiB-like acyl-CoA transferase
MAPLLGEDNAAVLAELGYTQGDIAALEGDRVLHNVAAKSAEELP